MLNKKEVLMVFLCVQCVYTAFVRYTPIVKVAEGRLRGIRDLNRQNQYFGIPYSISERFQPPKPPRKWSGLFEAVQRFSSCPQNVAIFNFGTEDCLKLDVYTPEHASIGQKLPVLVFFHGGAYYYDNTLPDRLPSTFSWCSEKDKRRIADKIRSHYFGTQRINSGACTKELINLYSDWIAYASIDAYSRLMAKYSDKPIYNYMFSYEGNRNFASFLLNSFGIPGTTHSDDIFYLFKPGGITFNDNNLDKLMIEMFTTMITNFMKFGDPTPTESKLIPMRWPPITANWTQVMNIDHPMSVIDTPDRYRGGFFLELLCEFGLKGYVPCESAMHCNLDE
ncbi:unnamed protein product [Arctia plantaginis]|uniref:Carboxylesterase type B domain-containing protein n=1 Tax=Arctia plantaginis TaxID=874455 RepID=A0A8S1AUD7_ARCPL|nr:unnamed protein product [Arctia plantaginis]